ncbi:hypothetical protein [Mycobacteroides abscessus]|uniref:hypothetical protein n=1 Tax=Mycobacteroides abscessus TaxID=36809 RepID=UPI0009A64F0B|nr:hypothetical protein [Mycobacteroides abscessus]MDM3950335.1 hypothetical protein [Mycobacteroides abscessus]SLJ14649.1 Uncharacterised protein [Mycobacteroides abscessus subsp. massiliense]
MQKPTKAFADMVLELADRLLAVLKEIYPDGDNQGSLIVSPDSLRAVAREFMGKSESHESPGHFEPLRPITMYQAQCTLCGTVVDDYGDYSCMDDDAVIGYVCESLGWFEVTRREPAPTVERPNLVIVHTVELLCPDCQRCEVCGAMNPAEIDEHLVCVVHEAHDFSVAEAGS